ncbi:MAG: CPBP family intramembrane metalloprotease, partial [Candidatus Marinimicrobia bacterium]|nr:CPBP family intramembrane metalloprotease [Candidatus Neomarinimicrobiota bacterium]
MKKNTLLYLALVLAIIGIIYSLTAFDRAFPIVNVRISADKHDILHKADSLTQRFAFMDNAFRSVAVFDTDERFKNFVELEGGGVEVFQEIVNTEIYHPYTWRVRQFNINEIRELEYVFSPSGDLLGFRLTLPDSLPGADIADPRSPEDLIVRETQRDLLPDLSDYALIEQSSELKEGGRRDHLFTYERKDAGIGEGNYRMRIRVSGDELTLVSPFVKIPDAFDLRYEEMRSANTTISLIGQAVMLVLYGILGVGVALFFMLRKKILLWKPALKWSVFIGVMVFLAQLTTISLAWFSYDTSLSSAQFLMQQIFMALLQGLLIALIFFISSMAGEGLDRQAFPGHIQFWRSWSPTIGASREIMRQTVFGYLWAFFMVGFITFFYWVTNHVFDWWSPAENMVDPNVLALPLPWLLPAANSLQAGFWEECLFRAVPLAGAVLIGKNFRKKGLWIVLALILQALIFGSMHANYAQQPAYARIIEMLIPFVLYGLIYIRWGLLPVVVSHFVYDIVLMAMPLFLLSSPGIWLHRIFVIFAALIPLLVVIRRRVQAKAWYVLREHDFNAGYREAEPSGNTGPEKEIRIPATQSYRAFPVSVAAAALLGGCALWILLTPFEQDVARLDLDRRQALSIAGSFTEKQIGGFDTLGLTPYLRCESDIGNSERFVWEQSN